MNPSDGVVLSQLALSDRRERIFKTLGYYVAFVSLGLVTASLGPTLPGLAEHTQSQTGRISLLFTAYSLGYLSGSFQGGRWYDREPGHRVMAIMLVAMFALMACVPVVSSLWVLLAAWLILGAAAGTLDVGGNTLLVWVHRDQVGPYMNGLHFFFGVGAFLSPLIIDRAMLLGGDIIWAYWALALLMLPGLAWLLRLPSPTTELVSEDNPQGQVNYSLLALIVLFFFLFSGAELGYGGWIFSYATALQVADQTVAAHLTSGFWGALTLGRLLAVPIAARLRPRFVLGGSLVGCLASAGPILLWPNSLEAIWLSTLGMGLFMASVFPSMLSLAGRHMNITGRLTGWFFVGASLGGMVLPWMMGQLFERIGPSAAMVALAFDLAIATGVFAGILFYLARPGASRPPMGS